MRVTKNKKMIQFLLRASCLVIDRESPCELLQWQESNGVARCDISAFNFNLAFRRGGLGFFVTHGHGTRGLSPDAAKIDKQRSLSPVK
jgi:hypothetical protein